MMSDGQINWLRNGTPRPHVKEESSEWSSPLFSSTSSHPSQSPTSCGRSSLAGPKRQRPYPTVTREAMSSSPAWSKDGRPLSRHSSDGSTFSVNHSYSNESFMNSPNESELFRPPSSSGLTSSLTGAMGNAHIAHGHQSMPWGSTSAMPDIYLPLQSNLSPGLHDFSGSQNESPNTVPTILPSSVQNIPFQILEGSPWYPPNVEVPSLSPDSEIRRLRKRVYELEEYVRAQRGSTGRKYSTTFQTSWNARTEARRRKFCSLNRAGNALCSWHDSRRERRTFPPRNAPQGYLNCGCTYEEALFEESLSRHGVGSYRPGEMVRMDPALRNPLLKLLSERYGYKDGDFEHNPLTEEWMEGQSPADWESANAGGVTRKKSDAERH